MRFINKLISGIVSVTGILGALACSNANDEQQRRDLLKWLDHHLTQVSQQIEADIEQEKQGFYAHDGKTDYQSKGYIDYVLQEKTGARLLVSQRSSLTLDDIKNTDGFNTLNSKVRTLQLQMNIKEHNIDGDEVETAEELDEYIHDVERYFVITVSGW